MKRARSGFSLIEMMVVFVIAGVLMGLSAGRISAYVTQQRVVMAAAAMQNDLQQAFAIAGRNRQPIRIVLDTTQMMLSITNRSGTTVFRRVQFGKQYTLNSSNVKYYPSTPYEIYPNGLASDTMSITLSAKGYARNIKVSRAGMVQVRNP
jgi:prepilin-type N-terminal cleavage/methylation domain-containing protein